MTVTLAESLGYSILGIAIVFIMLALLMGVIYAMGKAMVQSKKQQPAKAAAPEAPAAPAPAPAVDPKAGKVPARGSLGDVDLHTVDDRTAAILMAIVADKMGAPLNELRFISITEKQLGVLKRNIR